MNGGPRNDARDKATRGPSHRETPDVYEIPAPDGYRCLAVFDDFGKEIGRVQLREYAMDDEAEANRLQAIRDKHHPRPQIKLAT
jgi:hypothetical protein